MIRKLLFIIATLVIAFNVKAAHVTIAEATTVALNFYTINLNMNNQHSANIRVKEIIPIGEPYAYVINFDNEGFVIVAADKASVPVLGYSNEGNFLVNSMPEVVADWMQYYQVQINDLRSRKVSATESINGQWHALLNGTRASFMSTTEVAPLLTTTWDQGSPYNLLCPQADGGPGGRVYAGCVATAMSQVINYWRYPLTGIGSHGYYSDYGYLFADYASSYYDYNQMNPSIGGESNYEMAEIQYHCGIAVNMMYSPTGSGAYSDDAADALRSHFGYNSSLNLEYKDDYSDQQWTELLQSNLNNKWPMYYHGFGSGGHAFNVDGYQNTNYFHFNWGWSGSYNGYFYLTNLNPGGNNFTWGQGAIVNFYPDQASYPYYCSGVTTLTRHNGTFEDGSGPVNNYQQGTNCGWLIAPEDSVTGLRLFFDKFNLAAGDVINVFDGPNSSAPTIGSYTAGNAPGIIESTSGQLYVEFISTTNQGQGWLARYTSNIVIYCSGVTRYTEPEGIITDGSGPRNYRDNTICKHVISPENAEQLTIIFNQLDTEANNDFIRIYDLGTQQLVAEVSGNQLPGSITINSGRAYILFSSNGLVNAQGWELSYSSVISGVTSIQKPDASLTLKCSPNPASTNVNIELNSTKSQLLRLLLVTPTGIEKPIFNGKINAGTTNLPYDLSNVMPGVYMIQYQTDNENGTQKIIVR